MKFSGSLKINVLILLHFTVLFITSPSGLKAQDPIFDIDLPVRIRIIADFDLIIRNREIEELPATIIVAFQGEDIKFDAAIEARGNFRRKKSSCDFPPIRILFKKGEIKSTLFEGNTDIKVVTHCRNNSKEFIQYLGREYIIYKIYNLLSPYSFKVKMVEMIYEDVNHKIEEVVNPAFLIEDIDHLAKRMGMKEIDEKVKEEDVDRNNLLILSVFQYMIGNTDWIISLAKNLKFISDGEKVILVPYDFDYTALVNTNYARGDNQFVLSKPQRNFKGPCFSPEELNKEFSRLNGKRNAIFELIGNTSLLRSKSKSYMKNYINEFYSQIENEKNLDGIFRSKCK